MNSASRIGKAYIPTGMFSHTERSTYVANEYSVGRGSPTRRPLATWVAGGQRWRPDPYPAGAGGHCAALQPLCSRQTNHVVVTIFQTSSRLATRLEASAFKSEHKHGSK